MIVNVGAPFSRHVFVFVGTHIHDAQGLATTLGQQLRNIDLGKVRRNHHFRKVVDDSGLFGQVWFNSVSVSCVVDDDLGHEAA